MQSIIVLRHWRGDAHLVMLAANRVGPCDCNVIQCATGRFSVALARSSRQWNDDEWAAATGRLVARGWLDADGNVTAADTQARQQIEVQTDEHCAALWDPIGDDGARLLASIIAPVTTGSLRPARSTPCADRSARLGFDVRVRHERTRVG